MIKIVIYTVVCFVFLSMFILGYRVKCQEQTFRETIGIFCGMVTAMMLIGCFNFLMLG